MKKYFGFRVVLLLTLLVGISLACQAGNVVPSFLATPTPTYTITPTPTSTATPLPTSTPASDVSLEPQADGSELFIDPQTGFSLSIPSTWAGIPANVDDISQYMEKVSEDNPQLSQALSLLKEMDPNILRIMALDTNADHYTENYAPNFTVISLKDPISTKMSLEKVVQVTGSAIKSQYPGASLLDSGVEHVNGDFSYGYHELQLQINAQAGKKVDVFQKQVYFLIQDYLVVITLSAPANSYEEALIEFNSIVETVQLLDR